MGCKNFSPPVPFSHWFSVVSSRVAGARCFWVPSTSTRGCGGCGGGGSSSSSGSSRPIHFSTAGRYVLSLDLRYRCRILRDSSRRESVMSHRNSKPHPNGAATALPFESLNVDSGSSLTGGLQSSYPFLSNASTPGHCLLFAWFNTA